MSVISPNWWVGFNVGILVLLFLDLFIFHRKAHEVSFKESIFVSVFWIFLALVFNFFLWREFGHDIGLEFLSGYLIEKSLSVDNLFIILLIFSGLKIPSKYQHRVLFWGILGAIVFRALFILVGAQLVTHFHSVLYFFGAILVFTAYKLLQDKEEEKDITHHFSIRWLSKIYPISKNFQGQNFFIQEKGIRHATPLLVALVMIEVSDIIFAIDSIPAVFAVTRDAFVAYSSNILAILGLRALYFLLAESLSRIKYLKPGLSVILGFVGFKLILVDFIHIPSWVSLLVISSILVVAAVSSWYVDKHRKK